MKKSKRCTGPVGTEKRSHVTHSGTGEAGSRTLYFLEAKRTKKFSDS